LEYLIYGDGGFSDRWSASRPNLKAWFSARFHWWCIGVGVLAADYWTVLWAELNNLGIVPLYVGSVGVVYIAAYVVVLRGKRSARVKVLHSMLVVALFVGAFSLAYFQAARDSPDCFGYAPVGREQKVAPVRVEPADAFYFTVGTLTTAGTGSLTPASESCRLLASLQMVFGIVLIAIGVGGVASTIMRSRR
jgi:hypothetical protein